MFPTDNLKTSSVPQLECEGSLSVKLDNIIYPNTPLKVDVVEVETPMNM